MATVTAFDKINKLAERSMPFEQYFGEMDLTPEQKRKRIALAKSIEDAVLFLFALYLLAKEYGQTVNAIDAEQEYKDRLRESLDEAGIIDYVADQYIDDIATDEVRVTAKRFKDDDYWTSDDRAKLIAENDSNICWNGQEFYDATASGKRNKRWRTMKDNRVRQTHKEVDDVALPINEPFVVGNSLLQYPGDSSLGASAEELCGCRCTIKYF